MGAGVHAVQQCRSQPATHEGVRPSCPYWQPIVWRLLPGSIQQAYLLRLLSPGFEMESSQGHIFSVISVWFCFVPPSWKRGDSAFFRNDTHFCSEVCISQTHFVVCLCQVECKDRRLFHISYRVGNYLDGVVLLLQLAVKHSHLISHRDSHGVLVR